MKSLAPLIELISSPSEVRCRNTVAAEDLPSGFLDFDENQEPLTAIGGEPEEIWPSSVKAG